MSTARLHVLRFDSSDQWFLGAPRDVSGKVLDPQVFTYGQPVDAAAPLSVPIENPGHPLDFSFASHDMLVVSEHVGELIARNAPGDVQRLPVRVEGRSEPYEILNVLSTIDCIDHDRTVGQTFPKGSQNSGEYEMIVRLRLDPTRVDGQSRIFLVGGWGVDVAVTEDLKAALEAAHVTGLTFEQVS